MDLFLKVSGGVLISLIFYLILAKQSKDISVLLSVAVCVMIFAAASSFIKPIINLLSPLQDMGNLDGQIIAILSKAAGISLISEIICQLCADAGNGTLGKTMQFLSGGVILWLAVPLFSKLMELVKEILVAV